MIWSSFGRKLVALPGVTQLINLFGFGSGVLTFLQTPSSANLAAALTDETGTGTVVFSSAIREKLAADRTYYVRTDGSDSNNGLTNNSGGAFLTIAKALSTVGGLDLAIYNVTIQLEDATWTESVTVTGPWVGSGAVTLRGATNACVISVATPVSVQNSGSKLSLSNLSLTGTTNCIVAQNGGSVTCGANMIFSGSSSSGHIRTLGVGSIVTMNNAYSITAGGARHFQASPGGYINMFNITITLSGTLNFSVAFAQADRGALISTGSCTFTGGTITGQRYNGATNAVIFTSGGGANHYPGNVAGAVATGAQYA